MTPELRQKNTRLALALLGLVVLFLAGFVWRIAGHSGH